MPGECNAGGQRPQRLTGAPREQGPEPHGYLPTLRGTYQWVVSYSGDADNNGASTTANEAAIGPGLTA